MTRLAQRQSRALEPLRGAPCSPMRVPTPRTGCGPRREADGDARSRRRRGARPGAAGDARDRGARRGRRAARGRAAAAGPPPGARALLRAQRAAYEELRSRAAQRLRALLREDPSTRRSCSGPAPGPGRARRRRAACATRHDGGSSPRPPDRRVDAARWPRSPTERWTGRPRPGGAVVIAAERPAWSGCPARWWRSTASPASRCSNVVALGAHGLPGEVVAIDGERGHRAGLRVHRRPGRRAPRRAPGGPCPPVLGPACSGGSSTGCSGRCPAPAPGSSRGDRPPRPTRPLDVRAARSTDRRRGRRRATARHRRPTGPVPLPRAGAAGPGGASTGSPPGGDYGADAAVAHGRGRRRPPHAAWPVRRAAARAASGSTDAVAAPAPGSGFWTCSTPSPAAAPPPSPAASAPARRCCCSRSPSGATPT